VMPPIGPKTGRLPLSCQKLHVAVGQVVSSIVFDMAGGARFLPGMLSDLVNGPTAPHEAVPGLVRLMFIPSMQELGAN
jgi:hypothetical protein